MSLTIEDLEEAYFHQDNWPEDLPMPGEDNIIMKDLEGSKELYRYQVNDGGNNYGMEIVLDRSNVPDPAEGVVHMLNQFAYLWRTNKEQVLVQGDGSCRRSNF